MRPIKAAGRKLFREGPIGGHGLSIGVRLSLAVVFSVTVLLFASPPAFAEPAEITQARSQAEALRSQVFQLDNELEQAREDVAYAEWRLEETKTAISDAEAKLAKAQADLSVASERFAARMDGIYREGNVSFWQALFSAESISDLINRVGFLNRIGAEDGSMVQQIEGYQSGVAIQREELDRQKEQQKELLAQVERAERVAGQKLAERRSLLQGKEREIARLEREEAERQAALAEQRRQQARRAAERTAAQAASSTAVSSSSGGSGGSGAASSSSSQPSRSVPRSVKGGSAVDHAMSMIGVPYVWGGESPRGFDCSGLVKWAYGRVGVSLPHSSRAQSGIGTPVSRGQLQPGDLVFFGSPVHHVGIYVGNGSMVEAPYTGASVRVRDIDRRDYAGARRIG